MHFRRTGHCRVALGPRPLDTTRQTLRQAVVGLPSPSGISLPWLFWLGWVFSVHLQGGKQHPDSDHGPRRPQRPGDEHLHAGQRSPPLATMAISFMIPIWSPAGAYTVIASVSLALALLQLAFFRRVRGSCNRTPLSTPHFHGRLPVRSGPLIESD